MNKNKILIILFLIGSMTNIFPEWDRSEALKSASEYDYPPFCIVNPDSTAGGFSVELLKAACEAMNMKIDFKVDEWNVIKQELADGKLDVLPLVGRTPEREQLYDFTFPYMTYHGAVFARTDDARFITREDLKSTKLMVLKGDNAEEYVRRVKLTSDIETVESFEKAFKNLSEGKCDIVVTQKVMGLNLVKQTGIINVEPLEIEINDFQQNFCFAVTKNNHKLLELINEGLSIVIANGSYDRLRKKWFEPKSEIGKTKLTIGVDANYPPFSYTDENGKPAGYNVDLAAAVAKQLGILIEIKAGSWIEIKEALKSGRIDAVAGMYFSNLQDRNFIFSPPHFIIDHVMVVKKDTEDINDVYDLKGKRIIVMEGGVMQEFLIKSGYDREVNTLKSQEDVLKALSESNYDCALVTHTLAHYYIERDKLKNLKVIEKAYLSREYCFAVKKGNENLLRNISDALTALNESGGYRSIHSKWFGAYHHEGVNYIRLIKYTSAIFVILLMLFTLFLFWNRTLKKQVAKRTEELNQEIEKRIEIENILRKNEKLLTDNEEKYRQIFDNAYEGIFITRPDGTILNANPEACRIFDRSEEEITSLGRDSIFDLDDPMFHESLEIRKKTGFFKGEVRALRKDGSRIHLFLTTNIYKDSKNEPKTITIFSDISEKKMANAKLENNLKELEKNKKATLNLLKDIKEENIQRRKAEENLRKLNEELENKVKERTKQLEDQNDELKKTQDSLVLLLNDVNESRRELEKVNLQLTAANKELEAFSYSVSHDLRAPLRAILGFSNILKDDYCRDLDDEGKRYMNKILDNTTKMQLLIDDLLEFSRVGRSTIKPADIKTKQLVKKIFEEVTENEKDRKFEFSVDESIPDIRGDRTLTTQMFNNIIGNAVKFTCKRDIADIRINYENDGRFHIISVKDNGAGFDEKHKHKIFEVFQRLHSGAEFPGTGVGMSIVAKVAAMHGWIVDAESRIGEGAVFFIKIPVNSKMEA